MPDPGVRDAIFGPNKPPKPTSPGIGSQPPVIGADVINGLVNGLVPSGGGGIHPADKSAALADIALERKKLGWQKQTGLRDVQQQRELGLKQAVNNALQRGIYDSGIRIENEGLVNRESNEAAADLKQQIDFALQALKNREKAIKAGGGGGGGGGGGIGVGAALDIISRIMGMGNQWGWYTPQPPYTAPGQGAPGYGNRTGSGSRY